MQIKIIYGSIVNRIGRYLIKHRLSSEYCLVFLIILVSNLTWYNFLRPPIAANTGFPINMFRFVKYYYLPFNFYSWPVSYTPMVTGFPLNLLYYVLNVISFNSYSVSFFIYNVGFEVLGGFSLFYLVSKFIKKYNVSDIYAILSVVFYAFNASTFLDGSFETGTAQLLIILLMLYLIIYVSKKYLFLLGFLSFFIFFPFPGGYPDGALILIEELLVVSLVILVRSWWIKRKEKNFPFLSIFAKILLILIVVSLSLSYLLFMIFASGSTLLAQSVSTKPVYVFGFIYDWIAVLPNALRLILNWGLYTQYAGPWVVGYLSNPIISLILYIPAFFALSSIIFLKRGDRYLYLLLIISIFAATTANPPFGKLFEFLMLYVGPLRAFYESDAYYPILVILYSFLIPVSIIGFSEAVASLSKSKRNKLGSIFRGITLTRARKFFVLFLILTVLIAAFPLYTGLVDESGSAMPVESSIPSYYFQANNYLISQGQNDPVMVFPGIYGFSAYQDGSHLWYNGIDLYPGLISNPSISDDLSSSYTLGRGNAYSVISYVYGSPIQAVNESYQNDNSLAGSSNFMTANRSFIKWVTVYTTDNFSFIAEKNDGNYSTYGQYYINDNIYYNNIGSHNLIGYLNSSTSLYRYNFLVLQMKAPVPTSSLTIGFMNTSGDFFYWVGSNDFLPTITPTGVSVIPVYLNDTILSGQKIHAIAIGYINQEGNPSQFDISIYSLRFVNSPNTYATIYARSLNILGIKYAYVDTGIVNAYGRFNGSGYNSIFSNSNLFHLDFRSGTVSIYSYKGYAGLFEAYASVTSYKYENSLLGSLFYNISSNSVPLYGLNSQPFTGSQKSEVTGYHEISPIEYVVNLSYNGPFALFFKEDFSSNWVATNSKGKIIDTHFEADGYGNGWIISNNSSKIVIRYVEMPAYRCLVTLTVSVPFIMLGIFIFSFYYSNYYRKLRGGKH